ncbi:MAG TPA: hypothetical protein VFS40_14315 [Gemmatimonadales bacterium]|nr:hypothetical protein [Gemmatimonadales bacterium]
MTRRSRRAAATAALAALALALATPAQAQRSGGGRLGSTTITAAVLDRFLAGARAAKAADERAAQNAESGARADSAANAAKAKTWAACRERVLRGEPIPEEAQIEKLQKEMMAARSAGNEKRYAVLVDSATALMHKAEARIQPKIDKACGQLPEGYDEDGEPTWGAQTSSEGATWESVDADSVIASHVGVSATEYGLLRERIDLFLQASSPRANALWTAEELAVLQRYRSRLEAALQ